MQKLIFSFVLLTFIANADSILLNQINDLKDERINREIDAFKRWENGTSLETKEEKLFQARTQNCFFIKEVIFEGEGVFNAKILSKQIKEFIGKNVCGDELNNIVKKINQFYIKNGYITTQSYIKPQNISSGTITITIIEGKIEYVNFSNNNTKNRLTNFMLNPATEGKNTNIRDVDQLTENLQSFSSFNYKTELDAGSQNGLTRLNIKGNSYFPFILNASSDNTGAKNTGKWKKSVGLNGENLIGIGDEIHTKYLFSTGETGKTSTILIGESIIFRYLKLNYDFSLSSYENSIKSGNITFVSSGKTASHNAGLSYTFFRKTGVKLGVFTNLNVVDTKSYINDVLSKVQSRKLTNAEIGLSNNFYSHFGSIFFKLTYTRGLTLFDGLKDKEGLPREAPNAQFEMLSTYFLYNVRLPFSVNFATTFSGQYSKTELYSQNQFSIGSSNSVRGYENSASGPSGFFLRNDVSRDLLRFFKLGVFADYGQSHSYVYDTDKLASYGAFLEFKYKKFNVKTTFAKPYLNELEEKGKVYLSVSL
jgi:hemolysin activation/secretion protein